MNARERFSDFISGKPFSEGTPAAFFQHFGPLKRHGESAFKAQADFFNETGMDIIKIMFDDIYPKITNIKKASDWADIPNFSQENPVFTQQIELARRLVRQFGQQSYVFQTAFSPFVSAGCAVSPIEEWDKLITPNYVEEPQIVYKAMNRICDVLKQFAEAIAETGIDGFYVSIQGGEYDRFNQDFFNKWVKPVDLAYLNALKSTGKLVFMHLCGTNMRLEDFYDYPCDIVNLAIHGNDTTLEKASRKFGKVIMGGMDNHGVICSGTKGQIEQEVYNVLTEAPAGVMLGADCTIPMGVPVQNLRWAVDAAHAFRH